jgi:hypothetical protein
LEPEFTTSWDDPNELTLAVRLLSPMTRSGRLVGTYVLGAVFSALTYVTVVFENPEGIPRFMWIGVIGVFGLLAALLVWSALMQTLSLTVPETILEVEKEIVEPGETIRVCVKQPGPVHLVSLRANLIGQQRTEHEHRDMGKHHTVRSPNSMLLHENFLDADGCWLHRGQTRQWITELTIPENAADSGKDSSQVTEWKIEVWGRANLLVRFMFPYFIKVRRAK